jgi:predicted nucleotidyltransferase
MRFGLKETDVEQIITLISKDENVEEIILFGSRAKGNLRNGSYIDIALKGASLDWGAGGRFQFELDDSLLSVEKTDSFGMTFLS